MSPKDSIRLGFIKLREANIAVELFPTDLISEAEELNREFKRDCGLNGGASERETAIGEMIWKIRMPQNEVRS